MIIVKILICVFILIMALIIGKLKGQLREQGERLLQRDEECSSLEQLLEYREITIGRMVAEHNTLFFDIADIKGHLEHSKHELELEKNRNADLEEQNLEGVKTIRQLERHFDTEKRKVQHFVDELERVLEKNDKDIAEHDERLELLLDEAYSYKCLYESMAKSWGEEIKLRMETEDRACDFLSEAYELKRQLLLCYKFSEIVEFNNYIVGDIKAACEHKRLRTKKEALDILDSFMIR